MNSAIMRPSRQAEGERALAEFQERAAELGRPFGWRPRWAARARELYTRWTGYAPGASFEQELYEVPDGVYEFEFVVAQCRPVIVSRHPAAVEFARAEWPYALAAAEVIGGNAESHHVLGRAVVGNIPMALASEAAVTVAIEFDGAPPRGAEYGIAEMRDAGARLTAYRVSRS